MKLSCRHAASSEASDFCRGVTSCETLQRDTERSAGQTAAAWEFRPELGLEVCGSSLFRASGVLSAQPALRHASDPLLCH